MQWLTFLSSRVGRRRPDFSAERDSMEAAHGEGEQRLSLITDAIPVLISYVDSSQRYRFSNKAYEEWSGLPREQVLGRHLRDILGELVYESIRPHVEEAFAGRGASFEAPVPYKGGGTRFVHATYVPDLRDGEVRGFVSFAVDITERKRAEAVRAMLASIVESSEDAIIGQTLDGTILSWNRGAEYMYGYTAAESIGRSILMLLPPDRSTELWEYLARIKGGERIEPYETVRLGKDGSRIDISLTVSPIRDAEGRVIGASGIGRDITARKRAEEERKELLAGEQTARAEAEAATRAKDDFMAVLSHELRTPLTSMLGWIRMLRTGRLLRVDEAARALESIERNTRLLGRLINDLLDVSRIVAGKLQLDKCAVDLVAVTKEAIESLRRDAEAKAIRIEMALDTSAGPVSGDSVRLLQIVVNLVSNAIKFTPTGGRVDVGLAGYDGHVRLTVGDTGQGIDPAMLRDIFDRFRQGDPTRGRHGGLGLGLAIVSHLVALHGGTVRAESPGKGLGATFIVDLPPLAARGQPASGRVRREAIAEDGPRLDHVHVLVVDDDADSRELVRTVLEHTGADVRAVGSVREALDVLMESRIDVLVSDLGMPGEDGFDLVSRVREMERAIGEEQMPAVALTAYAGGEDREKALAAGFQVHVAKPIDPVKLVEVVAETVWRLRDGIIE